MWLFLLSLASASDPDRDVRIGLRGVAESWQDDAIATVYRTGAVFGGATLVVDVWGPMAAGAEFAYRSVTPKTGEDPALHLLPVTFLAEARLPLGDDLHGLGALGAAMVAFTERDTTTALTGTRIALDMRVGARWDLHLIEPAMAPAPSAVQAVELDLFLGRRQQRPGLVGLDLSAWRAGFGLTARL